MEPEASREEVRRAAQAYGATNPGLIPLSDKRYRKLHHGDGQPAVVISTKPLRVAAYSVDLDAVALLRFPFRLVKEFDLEVGDRLLSTNSYKNDEEPDGDLRLGPDYMGVWNGFWPMIADFVTEDLDALEECKARISKPLWKRAETLG
jgi:hypothetical protein